MEIQQGDSDLRISELVYEMSPLPELDTDFRDVVGDMLTFALGPSHMPWQVYQVGNDNGLICFIQDVQPYVFTCDWDDPWDVDGVFHCANKLLRHLGNPWRVQFPSEEADTYKIFFRLRGGTAPTDILPKSDLDRENVRLVQELQAVRAQAARYLEELEAERKACSEMSMELHNTKMAYKIALEENERLSQGRP